jgi:hypothetical protein
VKRNPFGLADFVENRFFEIERLVTPPQDWNDTPDGFRRYKWIHLYHETIQLARGGLMELADLEPAACWIKANVSWLSPHEVDTWLKVLEKMVA